MVRCCKIWMAQSRQKSQPISSYWMASSDKGAKLLRNSALQFGETVSSPLFDWCHTFCNIWRPTLQFEGLPSLWVISHLTNTFYSWRYKNTPTAKILQPNIYSNLIFSTLKLPTKPKLKVRWKGTAQSVKLLYYFLKLETDYAITVSGFLDPFLLGWIPQSTSSFGIFHTGFQLKISKLLFKK